MEKLETFEEVKYALKCGEVITSNGLDNFYLRNKLVTRKFNGNSYRMTTKDFIDLYKDTTFYKLPMPQDTVDEKKDIEYYERIQKMN